MRFVTQCCVGAAALMLGAAHASARTQPAEAAGCDSEGGGRHAMVESSGSECLPPKAISCPICRCGDPIDIATGNVFETFVDYTSRDANPLQFIRYYSSLIGSPAINYPFGLPNNVQSTLGNNWRSNFDRTLSASGSTATVLRGNGQTLSFTRQGDEWVGDSDINLTLVEHGATWTVTDGDDTVETYPAPDPTGPPDQVMPVQSIKLRNGYTQTLAYTDGALSTVTDSFGRMLRFTHDSAGLLHSVTTPDGLVITYGYDTFGVTTGTASRLTTVSYSTSPVETVTYLYENAEVPLALTGIIDETGHRYAAWTYDNLGRALSNQMGSNVDRVTVSYDDVDLARTVVNALGQTTQYQFTLLQSVPKLTGISRAATSTVAAATETITYDANGYESSETDWNGNVTRFTNNSLGEPTRITEAAGTPQQRIYSITWNKSLRLPTELVMPGLTRSYTYDAHGEPLTQTDLDTTTTSAPYATAGESRVWTLTWSKFNLASAKGPRTDLTQLTKFTYDANGTLATATDALGHVTRVTKHRLDGLPLTVVDPNGVTMQFAYDPRQRLLSRSVVTKAGTLVTSALYDPAGDITHLALPDGASIGLTYDTAHRLTQMADQLKQKIDYAFDALDDPTAIQVLAADGGLAYRHSATFDTLGRRLKDIGGAGEQTGYGYDGNDNPVTITDPLARVTRTQFDALDRAVTTTDPAGGVTTITYDGQDRPVSVVDPAGHTTTYVYDGFGDAIEIASPDAGTTVYRYDLAGNLVQGTDARGAVATHLYDALNRPLTASYPKQASRNVTYTYDQAGHGFGIGRATSIADQAGTLALTYDEQGNLLTETRVRGSTKLVTDYAYDRASRVAAITYPSGWSIAYARDPMGRITGVTGQGKGAAVTIASGIEYQPFGPAKALTYGNGVAESRGFDLDYRLTTLAAKGKASLQSLAYSYDLASNVRHITDGVTASNSQTLGYDTLDRLISASGTAGSFAYGYDAIGNPLTQGRGGATGSTFHYAAHSNRLTSITTGSAVEQLKYTAAGNVASIVPASGPSTVLAYDDPGHLASVSVGGAAATTYAYDGLARRLVKTTGGTATLFQYDMQDDLLEDVAGASPTDYVYLDGRPIALVAPGTGKVNFLHVDRLGTPQLATGSSQAVAWRATYQPFGAIATTTGSLTQRLRLPGQYADAESGFYHNGYRDYAPTLGRYVESDPAGQFGGWNSYAYADDAPLELIDPLGLKGVGGSTGNGSGSFDKSGYNVTAGPFTGNYGLNDASVTLKVGPSKFVCKIPYKKAIPEFSFKPPGWLTGGWAAGLNGVTSIFGTDNLIAGARQMLQDYNPADTLLHSACEVNAQGLKNVLDYADAPYKFLFGSDGQPGLLNHK